MAGPWGVDSSVFPVDLDVGGTRREARPGGSGSACAVVFESLLRHHFLAAAASPLIRFLLVILMIMKEARDRSLERRGLLQITDSTGAVKELSLKLGRNSIPAH
jgi:hypothetical protein